MVAVMKLKLEFFLVLLLIMMVTACSSGPIAQSGDRDVLSEISSVGERGAIAASSFKQIYETAPEQIQVIDVRSQDSFRKGSFKGSINIPIDNLVKQIDNLNNKKPIVFVCNGGVWAAEAYDIFQMFRPDLKSYYLNAGITFNADGSYTFYNHKI